MNLASWIIIAVIALLLACALFALHRSRRNPSACSNCSLKGLCRKE